MSKLGLIILLGTLAGNSTAVPAAAPSLEENILIRIHGDQDTRFHGTCQVRSDGEDLPPLIIGGAVPFEHIARGENIRCRITQDSAGSLEIQLEKGTNRSRSNSNTNGGTVNISMG